MKKLTPRIENIFSHAVALQQAGRLKSSIYCLGKSIYILNQDHTVLLSFPLRDLERSFSEPISFDANDYDSDVLEEKDGKICFITENGEYTRTKSCKVPKYTPVKVKKMFLGFQEKAAASHRAIVTNSIISLLDEGLSHIEFSAKDGNLSVVQRDIYSGAVIRIEKKKGQGFGSGKEPVEDFKPVGLRTDDFLALFTFASSIAFYFGNKGFTWFNSQDMKMPFKGIISQCIYDELGG